MSKYPKCFPENFEAEILPKGAKEQKIIVYRIIKYQNIRDNFISTFEETEKKLRPSRSPLNCKDPGTFSTSCFKDKNEAEDLLGLMMRHKPEAYIAKGETAKCCGPCQLTLERNMNQYKDKKSHVDWWIYADATPEVYFELKENEDE